MPKGATADTLNKVAVQMMNQLMPKDILESLTTQELDEACLDLQLDPQFNDILEQSTLMTQEAIRQTFLYYFINTFGQQALNSLSPERQDGLRPRLQLTSIVAAVAYPDSDA